MPGGTFFWPSEGPKLKRYTGSDPNDATPERFYHILKPYQESKNAYLPSCFRVLNSSPGHITMEPLLQLRLKHVGPVGRLSNTGSLGWLKHQALALDSLMMIHVGGSKLG